MSNFLNLERIINKDIEAGFPGISINVGYKKEKVYQNTFGHSYKYNSSGNLIDNPQQLTPSMLFDVASLTKIFATTYAVMYLFERKQIDLDVDITKYIPEFKFGNSKSIPTCRDLLTHSSGLAPFFDFFDEKVAGKLYSQTREQTIKFLNSEMLLQEEPRKFCIYTDIGMKILGSVVEAITQQRLDNFVEMAIYRQLDLKNTCFNPLEKGYKPEQIVATQIDGHSNKGRVHFNNIKTNVLRGDVHDGKALYSMGGVAGHAGLFSTISDINKLIQLLYLDNEFFSQQTVKYFSESCNVDPTHALGFWKANGRRHRHLFGEYCSSQTIGHTGFTGMCFIYDIEHDINILIMSNSVHTQILSPWVFEGKTYQVGMYARLIDEIYKELKIG